MPLLDFNPRHYLQELRQAKSGDLATVATVATACLGDKVEKHDGFKTTEESLRSINRIRPIGRYPNESGEDRAATAATVATDENSFIDINELSGISGREIAGYRPAIDGYSANLARKLLSQMDSGQRTSDEVIIDVLRNANSDFMERAAIAEIDGGLTRHEAESLALEEIIIEWWEGSEDRKHARAILWGDVRRLAFKHLLKQVCG